MDRRRIRLAASLWNKSSAFHRGGVAGGREIMARSRPNPPLIRSASLLPSKWHSSSRERSRVVVADDPFRHSRVVPTTIIRPCSRLFFSTLSSSANKNGSDHEAQEKGTHATTITSSTINTCITPPVPLSANSKTEETSIAALSSAASTANEVESNTTNTADESSAGSVNHDTRDAEPASSAAEAGDDDRPSDIAAWLSAAAMDRALRLEPDEAWDTLTVSTATDGEGEGRVLDVEDSHEADSSSGNSSSELLLEDGEHLEMKYTPGTEIGWHDLVHNIKTTKALLGKDSWSTEEWFTAETLCKSVWATQPSVRAVVLQFALFHRALLEKESLVQTNDYFTSQQLDPWLGLSLTNRMLSNWRLVYKGGQAEALRECNLAPNNMLDTVVSVYHDRFKTNLSEWTMYLILDADLGAWRPETPDFSQEILDTSLELYQTGDSWCKPKAQLFNCILQAWIKSNRGHAAAGAVREVFDCMTEHEIPPNGRTYKFALRILCQQRSPDAGIQAESLLQRMYSEFLDGAKGTMPDTYAFNLVVAAWAKSGSPEAGPRSEQIYRQLLLLREQGHLFGSDDISVINNTLLGYTNSKARDAPTRSEAFWRSTGVAGDSVTYSILIKRFAQLGKIQDVDRLLKECQESSTSQANIPTYVLVFKAYAESKLENKGAVANHILKHLEQDPKIKMSTIVYNAYLSVIARDRKGRYNGELAERTLLHMIEAGRKDPSIRPDFITYSTVINAWARAGQPDRASRVLKAMYDDYLGGNEHAKPDRQSFNTVLKAFTKSEYDDVPQKAEAFFREMQSIANQGDLDIHPDTFTYSARKFLLLLTCLSKTKDMGKRFQAAEKVEELLHEMKQQCEVWSSNVRPNVYCYNNTIDAWARAGNAQRAEAIFLEMCEDFKNGNESAEPETATFNILLKAWAFSKRPEAVARAEQILQQMHDVTQSGAMKVPPDIRTYSTLVMCLGMSRVPGSPQRAEAIVRHVDYLHKEGHLEEGPNKHTFNTLLKAWKFSNETNKREKIRAIKKEIRERFGAEQQQPNGFAR